MSSTDAAPLSQALLAASQSASYALVIVRGLSNAVSNLFSFILILSPIPIILYALAPVLVFLQLAFSVLVLLPYHTILYLVDVLYPLYVFFGVAWRVNRSQRENSGSDSDRSHPRHWGR